MRVLLDTNAFLWFIMGSKKLSKKARHIIEDTENEKFISVASLWEMAIKYSLGKLKFSKPFELIIPQQIKVNGVDLLQIDLSHITYLSILPFHHRDPFDRLIISQSAVEKMPVVGSDTSFDNYQIQRLW